ncbi:MAG: hypothetical protein AAF915_08985 [Cyanobacteria bacterium P01_D01_bin.50]
MIATFFIGFWVFLMIIFSITVVRAFKQGAEQLKKLHQIPCYKCDFFTNDYRLKCTVNPVIACSEEALGCIDFEAKKIPPKKASGGKRKKSNRIYLCETELQNLNSGDRTN